MLPAILVTILFFMKASGERVVGNLLALVLCYVRRAINENLKVRIEQWAVSEAKRGSEVTFLYVLGVGPEDATGTVGDVVILEAVEARRHKILQHCEEICRMGGVENTKNVVLEAHNYLHPQFSVSNC